jgi:hypothetical protein
LTVRLGALVVQQVPSPEPRSWQPGERRAYEGSTFIGSMRKAWSDYTKIRERSGPGGIVFRELLEDPGTGRRKVRSW